MFFEKIPSLKENKKLKKLRTDTRYSRINWTHHLKPLLKESYLEFIELLNEKGYYEKPYFECLSDSVAASEEINTDKDIYSDSISIQYGPNPVPVKPIITKNGGLRILVEEGASLVFAMSINGSVLAFIYPQKTEISKTKKKYYLLGEWRNPADITKSDIKNIFELLFKVQNYCGIYSYGKHSSHILAKLNAKDESIRGGTNPVIRYFKYFFNLLNGVRRIYGMGPPVG